MERLRKKIGRAIEQLELALEDIETTQAQDRPEEPSPRPEPQKAKPSRQPLPDHLPREIQVHEAACVCPDGGDAFLKAGEDVSEVLDYVPASFHIIGHVRPRLVCKDTRYARSGCHAVPSGRAGQARPG